MKYSKLIKLIKDICLYQEQWHSGESVWLSRKEEAYDTPYQMFLKNDQGYVTLHVKDNVTMNRMLCRVMICELSIGFYGWRHVHGWQDRVINALELNEVNERRANASLRTYLDYVANRRQENGDR
jgi:hypothetical protein